MADKCSLDSCPEPTATWRVQVSIRDRVGEVGDVSVVKRESTHQLDLCEAHGNALRASYPAGWTFDASHWERI